MSIAKNIQPHIPFLRRFARSLTGSQQVGDAHAEAVIEVLMADPAMYDRAALYRMYEEGLPPRVALYKILIQAWDSISVNRKETSCSGVAEKRLDAMMPPARQAFLLTTVEGFTLQEAALILGTDSDGMRVLVDDAGRAIAEQVPTNVLIIEDEPLIALDLERLVEGLGHEVSDSVVTHKDAIAAVERCRPGLILADIQLADGSSGLDAVNEILRSFTVPVIFITAYPESLLTGERPEPAFLITKPFEADMVKAVISQALFFSTVDGSKPDPVREPLLVPIE